MAGFGNIPGGGGGADAVARAQATANTADIATLNASQAAQDTLIAAAATQAQVDALQAVQDAEDPYSAFTRQADGSIDWTRESGATGTIAAPALTPIHFETSRGDSVRGNAPTAAESRATPVNGDTADVYLADGTVEHWKFLGAWGQVKVEEPAAANNNRRLVIPRANATRGVAPTAGEFVDPIAADSARVLLSDGTAEDWSHDGTNWALQATEEPGPALLDEDNMASDSATQAATQQSIKAYVDAETTRATAAEALRELLANKRTVVRATGTADDTAYPSEKAVRDALDALNFAGVYKGSAATVAALPAGENGDWAILTVDDGANQAGVWVTDGTTYTLAKEIPDLLTLTTVQATSVSPAAEYTQAGLVTAERLDEWGDSRRMRRIFNVNASFDMTALNYPDRTAIFVRNTNSATGISITYGAGGANSLYMAHANGLLTGPTTGLDAFNVQPLEMAILEKDGTDVIVSIFSGDRIAYFDDYAAANAASPIAHDGLAVIRSTGEVFGRKTNADGVAFPADGQPNADWFKVGAPDVVFPGDNGPVQVNRKNVYYADEAVPDPTAVVGVQGDEFVIARASYNSGSDAATQLAGSLTETLYTRDADSWVKTITDINEDGVQVIPDYTIADLATGAHPTSANAVFVPTVDGSRIKTVTVGFRDRRSSFDSGVRDVAPETWTLAELQTTKAGWTSSDYGGFRRHTKTVTFDGAPYQYYFEYRPVSGGSEFLFQDVHNTALNGYGGYEQFRATFDPIVTTSAEIRERVDVMTNPVTQFVAPNSGLYTFDRWIENYNSQANIVCRIGTTSGGEEVYTNNGVARLGPLSGHLRQFNTVSLAAGTTYYINHAPGGGTTQANVVSMLQPLSA